MSAHYEQRPVLGVNAWLVDDMYERYRAKPTSVGESWTEFFEGYRPGGVNLARPATAEVTTTLVDPGTDGAEPAPADQAVAAHPGAPLQTAPSGTAQPHSGTPRQVGAASPPTAAPDRPVGGPDPTPLRGAAGRVVASMTASLGVPTATSFRAVPARLLEVNRQILNNHDRHHRRRRRRGRAVPGRDRRGSPRPAQRLDQHRREELSGAVRGVRGQP